MMSALVGIFLFGALVVATATIGLLFAFAAFDAAEDDFATPEATEGGSAGFPGPRGAG